jgi:hypothetical protein
MPPATTYGPFEIVDDRSRQYFTVQAVRRPVMIWMSVLIMVFYGLVAFGIAVMELRKGNYSSGLVLLPVNLLVCVILFKTFSPFIWRPEVFASQGQLVLRRWHGSRRFSADELDGLSWEYLPASHKQPAHIRLSARCQRGPEPSVLLLDVATDCDARVCQEVAAFVVHCLERVSAGHRPERDAPTAA